MPDNNEIEIIKTESLERGSERPIIDFKSYETICNYHNDGSRRRGILSPEMYGDIVQDPSTGFIDVDGSLVPAVIDINHGLSMGYDTLRCKALASDLSQDVRILSLPFHELDDSEKQQVLDLLVSSGDCALYFSDHDGDEPRSLSTELDAKGYSHIEKPLLDERAKGDEQAALYLYSCRAEQTVERGERRKLRLHDVQDYYEQNMGPSYNEDGSALTTLNMGDRLSDEEAEEMWSIYDNMFSFLGGDNHPISMQDSKEDFYSLLRSGNTMISATYKTNENSPDELMCFTYFIDDIDKLYWLNQDFLRKNSDNNPDYVTDIFTPGIVSRGTDKNYAPLSIGFFARAADESGLSTNMTFENTNLSRRYIPRFVDHSMSRECKHMTFKLSESIDEVQYRLWLIKPLSE